MNKKKQYSHEIGTPPQEVVLPQRLMILNELKQIRKELLFIKHCLMNSDIKNINQKMEPL